jgi:hypothetical protein
MTRAAAWLALLGLSASAAPPPPSFWVSPTGSDGNDGSQGAPFATLPRAQLALRSALNNPGPLTGNATVFVLPGVYVQPAPLVFTPEDSGRDGFVVSWQCAGAILYVGVELPPSAWAPLDPPGPYPVVVLNPTGRYTPPPPPPPAPSPPGCGLVEPGISYNGNDIVQVLVPDGNLSACCDACASTPTCRAWSMCINITCGTPKDPVNCYLKTSAAGRAPFGPLRTSGTLPGPPAPPAPWRFYSLLEGALSATIARLPNRGSGYLDALGISNSDSSLTWPADSPYMPAQPFSVDNAQVFCNLGADWFTETRAVTGLDWASRTVAFAGSANGVAGCNNKAYLQGPKEFIDEPGEWALEPSTGLLYYFPYNATALTSPSSSTPVVAATSPTSLSFQGLGGASPSPPNSTSLVHDIEIVGLEVRGSDFTPDGTYLVFPPGRPNDTPAPTNTGMVRMANAANIALRGCKLLHSALSSVWLDGFVQNVTVDGCWIEGSGFCGVATNGPYPGDGPYASADEAYVNKGHTVSNNLLFNVGTRVGHGAGVWLFQSGDSSVLNNYIKEVPRNGVGMYGVRFGAGAGLGGGVLPASAYGRTLDFFSALDVLTTRNNTVAYNRVENVVRDSCDAGAFETWGVGVGNVFHTNSVSDCDSGGVDGSWMNFLFQDDASHFLNHSSNVLFNVNGKGSEEGGMIKSVFSVLENNVVAYSVLGHLFNLQPYIEPACSMTFARNVFAFLGTNDTAGMDLSVNDYTSATLAASSSLMKDPAKALVYNFTNATTPKLSDPVILELDYNLYHATGHNLSQLAAFGWDTHAVDVDPGFAGAATAPWLRTVLDLDLPQSTSPVYADLPGFRRIETERIGLGPSFAWDLSAWARRGGPLRLKIQAETYDRQVGLWREGSYAISPGAGGAGGFPFQPGAWASYARTDADAATVFELRITPLSPTRTVSLAVGDPTSVVATFSAAQAGAPAGTMGTYNVSIAVGAPLTLNGALVFLLPDGECVIDWFRVV